jgi:ribosomal protein S18 acetylase RimI-like enzyme
MRRSRCNKIHTPVSRFDTLSLLRREAAPLDLQRLGEFDLLCFAEQAWDESVWLDVVLDPTFKVTIFESSGVLIAVIALGLFPPPAHLASFAVHPAFRRRGLGRHLLLGVLDEARSAARRLHLEVDAGNTWALRLYRGCGFVALRRFTEGGRARLEMVHRLQPSPSHPRQPARSGLV